MPPRPGRPSLGRHASDFKAAARADAAPRRSPRRVLRASAGPPERPGLFRGGDPPAQGSGAQIRRPGFTRAPTHTPAPSHSHSRLAGAVSHPDFSSYSHALATLT